MYWNKSLILIIGVVHCTTSIEKKTAQYVTRKLAKFQILCGISHRTLINKRKKERKKERRLQFYKHGSAYFDIWMRNVGAYKTNYESNQEMSFLKRIKMCIKQSCLINNYIRNEMQILSVDTQIFIYFTRYKVKFRNIT